MLLKQSNRLLQDLALIENHTDETKIPLTLIVFGQIVTGVVISEDEYFNLPENTHLKSYFKECIESPRNEIIEASRDKEDMEFPYGLQEIFIHLKNAYYLSADKLFPGGEGVSMRIRVSDISSYSSTGHIPVGY